MILTNPKNLESELKWELPLATYEGLIKFFGYGVRAVDQSNTFYDSLGHEMLRQRWALRLRQEADQASLTLKGPSEWCAEGLQIRPEHEILLSPVQADAFRRGEIDDTLAPLQELRQRFGPILLRPLLSFQNRRLAAKWKGWLLEIDRTDIDGQFFYELEVETSQTSISELTRDLKILFAENHWNSHPSSTNKFRRACEIKGLVASKVP